MYNRILISTDGSELSAKAVDHALQLAASCGAEVVAMTVVAHYPRSYYDGSLPLSNEEVERVEKHWADAGHKIEQCIGTDADIGAGHANGRIEQARQSVEPGKRLMPRGG